MLIGNLKLANPIKDDRQTSGESFESSTHCYVNEVKLYNFKGDRIQRDSFCKPHSSNLITPSKANIYPFHSQSLSYMLINYIKKVVYFCNEWQFIMGFSLSLIKFQTSKLKAELNLIAL